jgi:hypothetical protein
VGTDHEVDCDLTNTSTSPLIRSLVCSSGRKTPHRHPSHRHRPGDPGPHQIRCLSPTVSISATTSSTSTHTLTFPLIRSLVCSSDRKTPHRRPSHRHRPGDLGPRRIRCLSPTVSRSATTSSTSTVTPASSMSSSSDKPSGGTH